MDPLKTFTLSMRRLASTVSVITCFSDGKRYGIAATAVTSLCADPASVLICINKSASIARPLIEAGKFCVNLLQSGQAHVSRAFGGGLKGEERFTVGSWRDNEGGLPYLLDAQANIFCKLDGCMSYGSHSIIIGRVLGGYVAKEVAPLLYQDGHYAEAQKISECQIVEHTVLDWEGNRK